MSVININITALKGQSHLSRSRADLTTAMERLSSGLRINSARDDAAGQGIANRMQATITAHATTIKGMNDGISLVQTAEGALDSINGMLHRSRELAVQAATGTLSNQDRRAIQEEFDQLREQIDLIAYQTQIFGKTPLAPTQPHEVEAQLGSVTSIRDIDPQVGLPQSSGAVPIGFIPTDVAQFSMRIYDHGANDDIQVFTQSGQHLIGTSLGSGTSWNGVGINSADDIENNVFTEANGFDPSAKYDDAAMLDGATFFSSSSPKSLSYNGMTLTYSGNGNTGVGGSDRHETLTISNVTEPLFIMVTGSGQFTIEEFSWVDSPPKQYPLSEPVDIVVSAAYGQKLSTITIDPVPADAQSLGIHQVSLNTPTGASDALKVFDDALKQVDGYRSRMGALNNRFEGAIENLHEASLNTQAAQSRIQDAEYAVEVSNLTRAQILQQVGSSMLAQANQVPEIALALLG